MRFKILPLLTLLFFFVPIVFACGDCTPPYPAPYPSCSEGTDLEINASMCVVGHGECHPSCDYEDSVDIYVPVAGDHTVFGYVLRGRLGQCQTNKDFFLKINGVIGPEQKMTHTLVLNLKDLIT